MKKTCIEKEMTTAVEESAKVWLLVHCRRQENQCGVSPQQCLKVMASSEKVYRRRRNLVFQEFSLKQTRCTWLSIMLQSNTEWMTQEKQQRSRKGKDVSA